MSLFLISSIATRHPLFVQALSIYEVPALVARNVTNTYLTERV